MQIRSLTKRRVSWLWALLPLLLAAALAIPLLDVDAFNGDEPASLLAAGILRSGPGPLRKSGFPGGEPTRETRRAGRSCSPSGDAFVGWSEVRHPGAVPLHRPADPRLGLSPGRDLLRARGGFLIAALLLSASCLSPRLHGLARDLCAGGPLRRDMYLVVTGALPCTCDHPAEAHRRACCWACIGLLYSHYLGALLLPVLGLFHLLFVPKNRRWWRPVLLFGLAGLVAALQLPFLLRRVGIVLPMKTWLDRILTAPG